MNAKCMAMVALVVALVAPPVGAQICSWDPLKDVQEALPAGVPSESKIIQARTQVSAMAGGQGTQSSGAAAVSPGVYLYQLTETGLAATLTVGGTKFFKDGDLN